MEDPKYYSLDNGTNPKMVRHEGGAAIFEWRGTDMRVVHEDPRLPPLHWRVEIIPGGDNVVTLPVEAWTPEAVRRALVDGHIVGKNTFRIVGMWPNWTLVLAPGSK